MVNENDCDFNLIRQFIYFVKNWLKRVEECNAYLAHVCRQLQIVKRSGRKDRDQELSSNTVAFIAVDNCRSSKDQEEKIETRNFQATL